MLQKFLSETEIFFDNYKKLSNANLSLSEKSKIKNQLKNNYFLLDKKFKTLALKNEEEKILVIQKIYATSKIMEQINSTLKNQTEYKLQQSKLRQKGQAERNRRTHQLIFIGCIWEDFLKHNNLSNLNDVKYFENVLHKIKNYVDVSEENIIIGHDDFDLSLSPYMGRDKKIIHYYCQIGGTWESFWRSVCKNDLKDKKIFKILSQNKNKKINLEKIQDDNFSDFKFFCSEKYCQKIGAFNNFFKPRCLKLDAKFFFQFLNIHKQDIIHALIQVA